MKKVLAFLKFCVIVVIEQMKNINICLRIIPITGGDRYEH